MQLEKNKVIYYVILFVAMLIFTPIGFLTLGTFYKALEHRTITNIIVWIIVMCICYYIYYGMYWLFKIIFKRKKINKPKIFDIWAIVFGTTIVSVICWMIDEDGYLFIDMIGGIATFIGLGQFVVPKFIKNIKKD